MDYSDRSVFVKKQAQILGFENCGISTSCFLDEEAHRLEKWLNQNKHGSMSYMNNHFDLRTDPSKLVDGAKSVISLTYNYYTTATQNDPEAPKISKYALGRDYHKVIKKKLKQLLEVIRSEFGDVNGRCFVDSGPVLERAWAQKSGLGWIGKNTMLLTKSKGSFYFLAEIITDLQLEADSAVKDYCGSCTKCIDACPTDAIYEPYRVDGSKCISYFTIELKDSIPEEVKGKFENWMFGCDICQDVCPINSRASEHKEYQFRPKQEILELTKGDWIEITEDVFNEIFQGSAVKRTGFEGLKRNIAFLDQ
ncbi:MAG: tRNA epoxyqueuosine(34) reductase QueG [Chitinophagales bacterium]|nr:tRNA epoxyqueuosine(34) reductase QueG [Chitinophagales bacterium]